VKFRIPDLMQIASRVMEHNRQAEPRRARNAGCMILFLKKWRGTLDVPAQCCGLSLPTLTKRFGTMAHQSLPASSNLNSETGTVRPESVDVAEAVGGGG
jgi:hypothetical protein